MKLRRGDVILSAVLIIAAALFFLLTRQSGGNISARVYYPDGSNADFSLSDIDGFKTIEVNGVVIRMENGRARFESSDCPDKLCVGCGWLTHNGDYAACLPNRVALCVISADEGGVDAVI